jgi:hypothetical protein
MALHAIGTTLALMTLRSEGAQAFPGSTAVCGRTFPPLEFPIAVPRAFVAFELALRSLRIIAEALLPLEIALWPFAGTIFPAHIWLAVAVGPLDERLAFLTDLALDERFALAVAFCERFVAARRTLAKRFWRARRPFRTLAPRPFVAPEVTLRPLTS